MSEKKNNKPKTTLFTVMKHNKMFAVIHRNGTAVISLPSEVSAELCADKLNLVIDVFKDDKGVSVDPN